MGRVAAYRGIAKPRARNGRHTPRHDGVKSVSWECNSMSTGERRSSRTYARFVTLFSSGRLEGSGALCNFSSTGALVEEATAKLWIGSRVFLHVSLDNDRTFEASGSVVRHTESGFAIEFEKAPTDLLQLVEDAGVLTLVIDDFPESAP